MQKKATKIVVHEYLRPRQALRINAQRVLMGSMLLQHAYRCPKTLATAQAAVDEEETGTSCAAAQTAASAQEHKALCRHAEQRDNPNRGYPADAARTASSNSVRQEGTDGADKREQPAGADKGGQTEPMKQTPKGVSAITAKI